jgi:hypothetical protein
VCLIDAGDQRVSGSKKSNYRLHYRVDLFTPDVVEMHMSDIKQGEWVGNFECFGVGDVEIGDRAYRTIQGIEYLRGRKRDIVLRERSPGVCGIYSRKGRG